MCRWGSGDARMALGRWLRAFGDVQGARTELMRAASRSRASARRRGWTRSMASSPI